MRTMVALVILLLVVSLPVTPLPEQQQEGAPRVPKTISTGDLAGMLQGGTPSVVDLRSDIAEYLKGHIPEAVYLHYETLRISKDGVPADMHPGEVYARLFSQLGLRMDRPVVIYSAGESNNFYATFLAWLLGGFGHPSVSLLDGGYEKWVKESRPVSRHYPKVTPTSFPAKPFTLDMVSHREVLNAMEQKDAVLVDARPTDQYEGRAGAQIRLGHIPGAISHTWSTDLVQTETGKVWKRTDRLRASYEQQGITPGKKVIVYCNTGTEATHLYFALRNILGYNNVSVYVPSFTDWAAREELPVEAP